MAFRTPVDEGYLGSTPTKPTYETMVIDNVAHRIHQVVVHEFRVGDVDDPDIYAGSSLWDWQTSEDGKWVLEHAVETPSWRRQTDYNTYAYRYAVIAKLREADLIIWKLKN